MPCLEPARQSVAAEDCDIHMEFGEIMLPWYEDWSYLLNIFSGVMKRYFTSVGLWNATTATIRQAKILLLSLEIRRICPNDIMNGERYLTMLQGEIWPVISAWEDVEDLLLCKMAPLHTFLLSFVNFWMPTSLGDGWVVAVRVGGQPGVLT